MITDFGMVITDFGIVISDYGNVITGQSDGVIDARPEPRGSEASAG